jgi:hypothetical protein
VDNNSTYEVANGIERCDVISFPIPKAQDLMSWPISMMCPSPWGLMTSKLNIELGQSLIQPKDLVILLRVVSLLKQVSSMKFLLLKHLMERY